MSAGGSPIEGSHRDDLAEAAEALASALHHENIGRSIRGWEEVREAFAIVKDVLRATDPEGATNV